jgi:hypothetical protein
MRTILTNCTVIDCTGKPPMEDMTVVIEGDRIEKLTPGMHREHARRYLTDNAEGNRFLHRRDGLPHHQGNVRAEVSGYIRCSNNVLADQGRGGAT